MAIITAIFGALLGLYINNIFTWKIKDKIDAVDALYNILWKIDDLFHKFVGIKSESLNDPELKQIQKEMATVIRNMYLHDAILDKKFTKELVCYSNIVARVLNSDKLYLQYIKLENESNKPLSASVVEYENAAKFFNKVLGYRKLLTSFRYMLKQLFCNWGTLIIVFMAIICWLLFYCFHDFTTAQYIITNSMSLY